MHEKVLGQKVPFFFFCGVHDKEHCGALLAKVRQGPGRSLVTCGGGRGRPGRPCRLEVGFGVAGGSCGASVGVGGVGR